MIEFLLSLIPVLVTSAAVVVGLLALNWLLLARHPELGNERRLPRQLLMLAATIAGIVAAVLVLPASEATRNQIIALIGVLGSGVIAFSSTTIVTNLMAGVMLRQTRAFRTGDFIQVGDHFGRVADQGLLDTEIQTEFRELVSLPNSYLIARPVTTIRSSGTIVSGTLSLGYDVPHSRVQPLLITAATETGLDDPFVQVVELGNFAITYRVCGLLTDVKSVLTTRSNLNRQILDALHNDGIEIVSPAFMNQRQLGDTRILPPSVPIAAPVDQTVPEEIVFDKAEQAAQREQSKIQLLEEIRLLEDQSADANGETRSQLTEQIKLKRDQLAEIDQADADGLSPVIAADDAVDAAPQV